VSLSVAVIETGELGDRSYVVHDGEAAVVVDPQRDLDRVEAVLARLGVEVDMVVETHVHNDYVTGGHALARRTGARYLVAAADRVDFARDAVADGDERTAGSLTVRVVGTPGHTDTHLAYAIGDGTGAPAVFSGGSLLFGGVGRTDLVDPARTAELARAQYRSSRRLAELVGDDAVLYPTHGFGSFCSTGPAAAQDSGTVGAERLRNDVLHEPDETVFVERLVAGLTPYPRYYAHMAALNRRGPAATELAPPPPVDAAGLRARIEAGEWVVDLRDRAAFAAEHVRGTVGIALGSQFATYLGWLVPWGTPVTLLGDRAEQITEAQRSLSRIGIDRLAGAAVGAPGDLGEVAGFPVATFADLAAAAPTAVLDVRRQDERALGHLPGSLHIPLADLADRVGELPAERVWVHCAAGFRAAIGASLLARAGHDVVLVDDDWAGR
jgi:hydroxyacylglutathione hydrolase